MLSARLEEVEFEDEAGLPRDFICPISDEVMKKPVTLCGCGCGFSYEEAHIAAWLQKNNTCPVSRCELTEKKYVLNRPLMNGIGHFKDQQRKQEEIAQRSKELEERLQENEARLAKLEKINSGLLSDNSKLNARVMAEVERLQERETRVAALERINSGLRSDNSKLNSKVISEVESLELTRNENRQQRSLLEKLKEENRELREKLNKSSVIEKPASNKNPVQGTLFQPSASKVQKVEASNVSPITKIVVKTSMKIVNVVFSTIESAKAFANDIEKLKLKQNVPFSIFHTSDNICYTNAAIGASAHDVVRYLDNYDPKHPAPTELLEGEAHKHLPYDQRERPYKAPCNISAYSRYY
jgi:vacuolar-type H+-ATPase subunit I/STV1